MDDISERVYEVRTTVLLLFVLGVIGLFAFVGGLAVLSVADPFPRVGVTGAADGATVSVSSLGAADGVSVYTTTPNGTTDRAAQLDGAGEQVTLDVSDGTQVLVTGDVYGRTWTVALYEVGYGRLE